MSKRPCGICETEAECIAYEPDRNEFTCPRCGYFIISRHAGVKILDSTPRQRANISSFIRSHGNGYIITSDNVDGLLSIRNKSALEKIDSLLIYIGNKTENVGDRVNLFSSSTNNPTGGLGPDPDALGECWALDKNEMAKMVEMLVEQGYVATSSGGCMITPAGYRRIAEIQQDSGQGSQGFIAMWFDDTVKHVETAAFSPAIRDAGYNPFCMLRNEHPDMIDDKIIAEIRKSRFLVADLTGSRGGVYYEAGFAHGLGLPVFFTCRDDCKKQIHFDIRQYNCLFWKEDELDNFKTALKNRIEATLGRGVFVQEQ